MTTPGSSESPSRPTSPPATAETSTVRSAKTSDVPHSEAAAATCSICLQNLGDSPLARLYPCRHASFHVSCIDTWLNQVSHDLPRCPLCRAVVSTYRDPDGWEFMLRRAAMGDASPVQETETWELVARQSPIESEWTIIPVRPAPATAQVEEEPETRTE